MFVWYGFGLDLSGIKMFTLITNVWFGCFVCLCLCVWVVLGLFMLVSLGCCFLLLVCLVVCFGFDLVYCFV